jgi:hypothetical protein
MSGEEAVVGRREVMREVRRVTGDEGQEEAW